MNQKMIEAVIAAIKSNTPPGTLVQFIYTIPQIGQADVGAGPVTAVVISESEEDLQRFQQLIERGQAVATTEYGLVAAVLRNGAQDPTEHA